MLKEEKKCLKCGNKLEDGECPKCKKNKPTFDPYDLERQTYPKDWEILTS